MPSFSSVLKLFPTVIVLFPVGIWHGLGNGDVSKLAVEMIFHPLTWRGIPLRVIEGQPFGLIGWQGIVPAKTGVMSERLVDMVTTQLVDVEEVPSLNAGILP